jgi:2-polyprenyl-3-methyl-5-hydroxy-6-metoxy-1,4-benzoquinol methylase
MENTFWNERFASDEYIYGTAPNAFFKSVIDGMEPGKILLPAEGEGRNAVYAASLGWDVHAFDYSEEGKKKALLLAEKNGVSIDYEISDFHAFLGKAPYDMIGLFFTHFPPPYRAEIFRSYTDMLSPGGIIVAELFSKNQLGLTSGGPKDINLLTSVDEFQTIFEKRLKIEQLEEVESVLDEGSYHEGRAFTVRFVGVK